MLVPLIVTETLLLDLLSVLVVGLLRSHAEILRRMGPSGEQPRDADEALPSPPDRDEAVPARDITGTTLDGDAVQVGLAQGAQTTLLGFLSSGCSVCENFWEAFQPERRAPIPGGARLILVTKDSSHESPTRLRELAPPDVPLVMSSAAWDAYHVPTAPYFVHVDGASGHVYGEGSAAAWPQVASLLRDALDDLRAAEREERSRSTTVSSSSSAVGRDRRADLALEEAGIGPGHPSLYPGGPSGQELEAGDQQ